MCEKNFTKKNSHKMRVKNFYKKKFHTHSSDEDFLAVNFKMVLNGRGALLTLFRKIQIAPVRFVNGERGIDSQCKHDYANDNRGIDYAESRFKKIEGQQHYWN